MPINYPASADDSTTLPDPTSSSYTNNPSHFGLHANENAAIKALEAKVGYTASAPPGGGFILTSSSSGNSTWQAAAPAGVWGAITGTLSNQTDLQTALNARVQVGSDISGTATAPIVLTSNGITIVTTTGAQTLTNKILTSPTINTGTVGADPVAALGIASKQYVDALGSTSLVRNETPGGSVNGSNVNFTTAATFATGSLKVYLNGQRLAPGSGIDYVEVTQGFTMQYAPATGDVLLVDYETTNTTRFVQGSNSYIVQEVPTGTVNGSTVLFTTLQVKYVANTLEVFLNGLQQSKTTDYTETSPGSGTFTFVTAPKTGDDLRVSYQFATGASGNADTLDGFHASSTPTASNILPLNSSSQFPGNVLGNSRLAAIESTDIQNGTALVAATWTDFKVNQNFTVASTNSIILVSIVGRAQVGSSSGVTEVVSRIIIDSGGTPITRNVGGMASAGAGAYGNPFAGSGFIIVTGLSAGTHTIKTQVQSTAANSSMFCRASSVTSEFFATYVVEIGG